MIPDNHAKSYLNESYVNAVATQAGFVCEFIRRDYGTDAVISEVQEIKGGKCVPTGYDFKVQMKATHDFKVKKDKIVYELDADAHDRLASHKGSAIYLIVFCLPQDPRLRMAQTEQCMELRNCCYWYPAPNDLTTNRRSETIDIPRSNVFDPAACVRLMDSIKSPAGLER